MATIVCAGAEDNAASATELEILMMGLKSHDDVELVSTSLLELQHKLEPVKHLFFDFEIVREGRRGAERRLQGGNGRGVERCDRLRPLLPPRPRLLQVPAVKRLSQPAEKSHAPPFTLSSLM